MQGTVTDILPQRQGRNRRFNVFLDGRYAFSLHAGLASSLTRGQALSERQVDELLGADQLQRAVEKALGLLAYRPRSEQEVRRRLEPAFPPGVVEAALERLRRLGLVDDQQFARYWVEQRLAFRPRGARALRLELLRKGVQAELAEAASQQGGDERESAYRTAAARARTLKAPDFPTFRRGLGAFLARRGFEWETINGVVRQLWGQREGEGPPEAD